MNIAMLIHSMTGNTKIAAERAVVVLRTSGHTVEILALESEGSYKKGDPSPPITSRPELEAYDALVFSSHVEAFSLSAAMKVYLADLPDLKGCKTALLLTQFFPFKWMGGLRALGQGKKAVEAKGGMVVKELVVNWSRKDRDKRISSAGASLAEAFSAS
ncbi:MAG: hypothetical protein KAH21_09805 [Spirochaetaceae bacterium]|nr:hypothetical protein [Spirochaetaceae bacterium]